MKTRGKNEVALIATGIMLGAVLTTPAATAALMAQQSSQKIYVDGQQIQIEAYSIGGSNYCKLRDVGKAVGFNVSYDPLTNEVHINTDEAYEDEGIAKASVVSTVALPTDGSKYKPQVGDKILCDDGYVYEIKDTTRWENNVFMEGPLPDLPTPQYDWSVFPEIELPRVECRHFTTNTGEDLFIRNLFETRRMIYTIYNALGTEPSAWRDGKPLAKVMLTIPAEDEPWTKYWWPWRASELEKHIHNTPNMIFRFEAFDYSTMGSCIYCAHKKKDQKVLKTSDFRCVA